MRTIGEAIGSVHNLVEDSKKELLDDEICLGVEMELEGGDSSSRNFTPEGWSLVSDGTLETTEESLSSRPQRQGRTLLNA